MVVPRFQGSLSPFSAADACAPNRLSTGIGDGACATQHGARVGTNRGQRTKPDPAVPRSSKPTLYPGATTPARRLVRRHKPLASCSLQCRARSG